MKYQAQKKEPKQRAAFRNNYLAAVLAVMALLFSSVVSAQSDSTKYSQINGYGFKYKRMAFDSALMVPLSTSPHVPYRMGAIRYNAADSTLQLWTGHQWNSIVTGGTGIDTAYMLNDTILSIETPDQDFFIPIPGAATQLTDSSFRVGNDTITIRGIDTSAIVNIGIGFPLLKTPDSLRSLNPAGSWFNIDTSFSRDELRLSVEPVIGYGLAENLGTGEIRVDTTGANGIISRSSLKDTVAAIDKRANQIDVFLVAGQSNAMGVGDSALSPKVSVQNVLQVNTGIITPANDPVGKNIGTSGSRAQYGSAWPAFGNTYYSTTGNKIAFIPSSYDGSAQTVGAEYFFGNWDTTGVLFDSAIARVNSGMVALKMAGYNPLFKGVLWCQGEADGKALNRGLITQADYIAALKKMIGKFRQQLNLPTMPFYMFRTGTKTDTLDAGYKLIRDAQQIVANIDTFNAKIIFYNAIDFPARGMMHDVAHFTQAGYNEMGSLGASAVVSGRVFNIDDVLITENNKLRINRNIDLNNYLLTMKNNTTDYFSIGNNRINSSKTHTLSDSLWQNITGKTNFLRSKTLIGDRVVEGDLPSFFLTGSAIIYNEEQISGNPVINTCLGAARYLYMNNGASINTDYNTIFASAVPRLRGAVTFGGSTLSVAAHQFSYIFTRATDFTASPSIASSSTPSGVNTNISIRTGFQNTGAITATGWFSGLEFQFRDRNAAHSVQNYADIISGNNDQGSGGTLTNRYGLYLRPMKQAWVTNAWAIYQEGTTDTNYFAGIIRVPNLISQVDTNNYKPVVVDASGNHFKMAGWPGSGGGGGSGTMAIGDSLIGGTNGSVLFVNPANIIAQDNHNFSYNKTAKTFHLIGSMNLDSGAIIFNGVYPGPSGSPQTASYGNTFLYNADGLTFNNMANSGSLFLLSSTGVPTFPALASGGTAPTTSGTLKPVYADAAGLLSFIDNDEVISTVSTYTNFTTTATYQNIASITLAAGDWDISAQVSLYDNGATIAAGSDADFAISTTTASASGAIEGKSIAHISLTGVSSTNHSSVSISPYKVSGSATYYLNAQAAFTVGNPQFVGTIRARRIK